MKRTLLCIAILFLGFNKAFPGVYQNLLEANKLYENGRFNQAITIYEDILNKGYPNPALYYNLANAYFRTKQIGKAVLFYERAFRLSPRDEDIRFNLKYVRAFVKEEQSEKGFLFQLLVKVYHFLTLNELTLLTCFLYFSLSIVLTIRLFQKKTLVGGLSIFLAATLLLSGFWLSLKIYQEQIKDEAIILQESTAFSGPGEDYLANFSVPEGKKVIILQKREGWFEIGLLKEGLKGWIKKDMIEKI